MLLRVHRGKCEGSDLHTITPETYASAELPAIVRVRTGMQRAQRLTGIGNDLGEVNWELAGRRGYRRLPTRSLERNAQGGHKSGHTN